MHGLSLRETRNLKRTAIIFHASRSSTKPTLCNVTPSDKKTFQQHAKLFPLRCFDLKSYPLPRGFEASRPPFVQIILILHSCRRSATPAPISEYHSLRPRKT
ncbi:hypothetical protein BC936DRAFT_144924 [Jimgerdemannia flammicorona]|uniref:Uncharacterized protein n=2 Tax=Jimgerdemannia flammicorona TaxID=994334 RepID=A0A433QVP7_9FUNG|nr:hypothetical protein BC936DRAFT_144924 [Jimgerdemannia flammicorona]RUS33870.1 hypothetical protein BC938DRAFT_483421 [Jimgerdemannia flammicorona]